MEARRLPRIDPVPSSVASPARYAATWMGVAERGGRARANALEAAITIERRVAPPGYRWGQVLEDLQRDGEVDVHDDSVEITETGRRRLVEGSFAVEPPGG